ncbi:MAG: class I fructose-bisphosphate aldolase [Minwuia sp.]|uniref:class I fructose-bisphosphate aldolase n=1 Tax=Minwuia sp. TaxID=2493630 RepID=UPI003A890573
MSDRDLKAIAEKIVADGRGVLAADESTGTIKKRFDQIGVDNTEENRRDYREMLFRAAGHGKYTGGVILFDETLRQSAADGTPLVELLRAEDVVPGIKVDQGAKPLAGAPEETVTEGLDGLRERFAEYRGLGADFAKWRAVIKIGADIPSDYCIDANAHALARYAALSQEAGIVPIVEPEVLMDGDHDLARCQEVTEDTLDAVFNALYRQRVELEGILLKPNMVISGQDASSRAGVQDVAAATLATLKRCVPSAVPGIVFLSGGQSEEEATEHLDAMNRMGPLPWKLSFSYGRALQQSALKAWSGKTENVAAGQRAYLHRARMNWAAARGEWAAEMEKAA